MFTEKQIEALKAPLDSKHVKQRSQAGRQLSYVEGWHAIAEANRIFGFGHWDRETAELRMLGEPREVEGKWRIAYMARVKITVYGSESYSKDSWPGHITREGTGYGSGIARDLGDAHESAIKEAETDAMKRALMTFGNPFGLALYDKEQREVTNGGGSAGPKRGKETAGTPPADSPPPAVTAWVTKAKLAINDAKEVHELVQWKGENEAALAKLKAKHPAEYDAVMVEYDRAKVELAEVNSMAAA